MKRYLAGILTGYGVSLTVISIMAILAAIRWLFQTQPMWFDILVGLAPMILLFLAGWMAGRRRGRAHVGEIAAVILLLGVSVLVSWSVSDLMSGDFWLLPALAPGAVIAGALGLPQSLGKGIFLAIGSPILLVCYHLGWRKGSPKKD